ncbi:MAG TPA: MBL fold metallo-hydrolase [Burkholderiales bacterium]|jgi:phosphoribosyl 1,2-cyclic phosphodiesterase|nr:MBL fold metallo-hydrolase [Burkholderiales bacterium]
MRFASLGSGSQGNALVVESGATRILLDCGFGLADTASRLARLGLAPSDLSAIVVTHEHDDHIGGVARLARRHAIPVWLTYGTLNGFEAMFAGVGSVNVITGYAPFSVGELRIEPFPVPHDAREPAQFVFGDGARRLGVLTDAGCSTPHIESVLSRCQALVLECNHDLEMLRLSSYPPRLRERIAGRFGHLDNGAAATLLSRLDNSSLQHLVAAHLSQENNRPDLARSALAAAIGCEPGWIAVADQDDGLDWRQIA